VPREHFVGPEHAEHAYDNRPLPVGAGQTISQPLVVAVMCELLGVQPGDRVLDVGTGSGWHAALLATLGGRVWSIERHAELSRAAAASLARAGIEGVELVVGDGSRGLPEAAPFDAINVAAASAGGVPPALEEQLGVGGRLVVPVGGAGGQRLMVVRRSADGTLKRTDAGGVRFVPLVEGGLS
jgi:protein-L-isoaspartate(D-aspartate) O-methyltransferase